MKTSLKLALVGALGLTLAGVAACAQTATDDPAPPAGSPPGRPGQMLLQLLDKYDANKDGVLDQTELAKLKQDIEDGKIGPPPGARGPRGPGFGQPPKEILDKYDVNKDGKLDENERAALHKDIQEGKIQPPLGRGPRGPGGPPSGPLPSAKDLLQKFDANKDGMLDEAELTAFLKAHRPPHPPAPSGPPPAGEAPPAMPEQ